MNTQLHAELVKLQRGIITIAYKMLIAERMDHPIKGEATFTQSCILGRIHYYGLSMSSSCIIDHNLLRCDVEFPDFIIMPSCGFYTTLNGSRSITFKQKT